MLGDYYPLTPYSLNRTTGSPGSSTGRNRATVWSKPSAVPTLRRDTLTVQLRGLDPQQSYEIENFDGGTEIRNGSDLMKSYDIRLQARPAAAVLRLKAVK